MRNKPGWHPNGNGPFVGGLCCVNMCHQISQSVEPAGELQRGIDHLVAPNPLPGIHPIHLTSHSIMIASIKDFFNQFIEPGIAGSTAGTPALQVATAALLLEMMRMDNELKDEERQAIASPLQTQFNLGREQIDTLMTLAEQEAREANDYYQFTSLINKYCDLSQKVQSIENLWHVAMIDGHLDAHELHLMRKLADLLYIGHADCVTAKQRARESAKLPT